MPVTTRARTQRQRTAEARERLISSAATLIAAGGLESVTLAKVGEHAGYSRGLANHHFGSKAQLLRELVDRVEAEFSSAVAGTGSGTRTVVEVVDAFFDLMDDLPTMHRAYLVLWAGAVTGDDEVRARMAASDVAFRRTLGVALVRSAEAGGAAVDADAWAAVIVGVLRGVALQWLIDPDRVDLGAARRVALLAVEPVVASEPGR